MSKTCCPDDSHPFLSEDPTYVPRGEMISFDEVSAYVVGAGPVGIVFIHDIYGLPSGMNKLVCDRLSEKIPNATILAPDFFKGDLLCREDPLVERGSALSWKIIWPIISCRVCGYIQKFSWDNCAEDIFNKVTSHMISAHRVEKFVSMGFCWGAYVGWRACGSAQHRSMIVGNISCHPSVHSICNMVKEDQITVANLASCPQLVLSTKDEPADWKPKGLVEATLSSKPFSAANEFHLYAQEAHGFVTRGDTTIDHTKYAVGDAIERMVAFVSKIVDV